MFLSSRRRKGAGYDVLQLHSVAAADVTVVAGSIVFGAQTLVLVGIEQVLDASGNVIL